ncbi:MAG TPA: ribosome biogenesis GTPase Der [Microscillaceae bacterium]|nr:ribosome biogenesis GTPase Der [Microscillaceae bacterium]
MSNIVAIVGRPNVGKSTLFNRLVEERKAIMDNQSGVTRDRVYGQADWVGKFFTVVDTGGYVVGSEDVFEEAIREQVEIALEEASVILFVVDCITGLTDLDKDFANILRRGKKPVIIVANKADNIEKEYMAAEFYELGMGDVFPISAQSGSGTGEILDEVVKHLEADDVEDPNEGIPKIAIIGRPNAGKSSLVNVLTGQERSIVTDVAGTTRDSINTHYKAYGKNFILTDTAGLRRKSRVKDNIEFYSTLRAIRSLEESDVCVVLVDATRGIEGQDVNIIGLADRNGKGIVIMINKWDLIEKDTKTVEKFKKDIQEKIAPMTYIPIIFGSVVEKQRIFKVVDKAIEVYDNRNKKISTSELNKMMLPEIEHYPPPAIKGKYIRIKYITQLPTAKPTFAFFCNLPQYIRESYQRYLENKLRKHFGFEGVPLQIFFRKK